MQDNNPPQLPQENVSVAPDADSVELIGKTLEDRQPTEAPKKKSLLSRYFGVGSSTPKPTKDLTEPKPNVPEQILMQWSAPEFVQTHKPAGWYLGFGAFFLVLIAIAIFTRQYITVGLFAVMGAAVLVYANRTPRVMQYRLSNYGISVGEKKYLFDNFDAFYETNDYGQIVLELVPNKRFATLVSLPPAEHQLDQLEATLSRMLPKVENKEDFVDALFRKLRF